MKKYLAEHYRILGLLGAIAAFAIAAVYIKIIPEEVANADGIPRIILLYGHSLCWILLSTASFLWGLNGKSKWPQFLAYTALLIYIIFIGTLFITKPT